ncbi:hypothetical protein GCM10028810_20860 [Spirosoma litoris]
MGQGRPLGLLRGKSTSKGEETITSKELLMYLRVTVSQVGKTIKCNSKRHQAIKTLTSNPLNHERPSNRKYVCD